MKLLSSMLQVVTTNGKLLAVQHVDVYWHNQFHRTITWNLSESCRSERILRVDYVTVSISLLQGYTQISFMQCTNWSSDIIHEKGVPCSGRLTEVSSDRSMKQIVSKDINMLHCQQLSISCYHLQHWRRKLHAAQRFVLKHTFCKWHLLIFNIPI